MGIVIMRNTINILCLFVFGAFGLFCEGFVPVVLCSQKKNKASGSNNEIIPGVFFIKNNIIPVPSSLKISVTSSVVGAGERNNDSIQTNNINNNINDGSKEIIVVLSPFEESIKNQFELLNQQIEQHQMMQIRQDKKILQFEAADYEEHNYNENAITKLSKNILKVESILNNKIEESIVEINDDLAKQGKKIEHLESTLDETIDDIKQLRQSHNKSTYKEQSITFRNIKIITR